MTDGFWSIIKAEAATNLVDNPSFETNTTGWAASGTNTIAKNSTEAKFGAYGLKCTYQDNTTLAGFSLALSTTTTYYVTGWVWVSTNWDGGNIRLAGSGYTTAAHTYNDIFTEGTSTEGMWLYLETKLVTAADGSGSIILEATSAPTAGRFVYFDALQVEASTDHATTYIDGDQTGCEWTGEAHESTSSRDAQSRAGGREYNLDAYEFYLVDLSGQGMPKLQLHSHSYSLQPGAEYQGYKVMPRQFALIGDIIAASRTNLHAMRKDLIDAIKPDAVKGAQPFIMRYTGADSEESLEIEAVYQSGLEYGKTKGFSERIGVKLMAFDPFFYGIGNGAGVMTTKTTLTARYIVGKQSGTWGNLGLTANPTTGGTVYAIAVSHVDGKVYFGGTFTGLDGAAGRDYIAQYDPENNTWASMDGASAVNGVVYDIVIAADGTVYFGGEFTDAGGDGDADYLAQYDPGTDTINAVSSGGVSYVRALAFGHDGTLYIGGTFENWNSIANADRIVKWDGSAYSALSTGSNNTVFTIKVHPNGKMVIGGLFTTIGGVTVSRIAYYNEGSDTFTAVGSANFNNTVIDIAIENAGNIYATGDFTNDSLNYIAKFDGSSWVALGDGLSNYGAALTIGADGLLWIVGNFASAGGLDLADRMAIWNGSSWLHPDIDLPGSPTAYAIVASNVSSVNRASYDLWIGFTTTGTATVSYNNVGLTNDGTSTAYPVIVVKRSGGTSVGLEWIKNETTGATLWFDYDLTDGEKLTIDLRPGRRSIWSNWWRPLNTPPRPGGPDVPTPMWRAMLRGSDFGGFNLLPGDNDISIKASEVGSPTITMTMQWRNTFWSFDGAA